MLHTGDLTHLAKPEEFDDGGRDPQGGQGRRGRSTSPASTTSTATATSSTWSATARARTGLGWYSFDHKGVHFVGLVNVADAKSGSGDGGLGVLGKDQLDWLKKDLAGLKDSTPVVVFAHVPLWAVYEKWGWGTRGRRAGAGAA